MSSQNETRTVLYINGESYIQDEIKNGRLCCTGETVEEYKAKLSPERAARAVVLTWDEVMPRIQAAEDARYIKPWAEITLERWDDLLNVLPPEKWQTVQGVNLFRLMERTAGNITLHVARLGDRCFAAERRTTSDYAALAAEVAEAAKAAPLAAVSAD